ncbi:hypothetical protein [Halorientalis regularis]|jgi:hypothetical protein|uniref:Uncharacterized protein n=1 Tax=Halorientalis regularis TaxID=660518 RepID=A0A1G7TAN2_9EURY|nr:hypothetical protein [Halorientalis regularis]SDG32356.1 hypothetical protein SAMN05216218_12419 [Halorientalis regularis]
MTLLDRIREWLFGADESESPDIETGVESTPEESDKPQLDPDNVTEVRSTRDDDPVSQLQNIQEEGENGEQSDN